MYMRLFDGRHREACCSNVSEFVHRHLNEDDLDQQRDEIEMMLNGLESSHEKRLIRLETIIEIARPDGAVPRLDPIMCSTPRELILR